MFVPIISISLVVSRLFDVRHLFDFDHFFHGYTDEDGKFAPVLRHFSSIGSCAQLPSGPLESSCLGWAGAGAGVDAGPAQRRVPGRAAPRAN